MIDERQSAAADKASGQPQPRLAQAPSQSQQAPPTQMRRNPTPPSRSQLKQAAAALNHVPSPPAVGPAPAGQQQPQNVAQRAIGHSGSSANPPPPAMMKRSKSSPAAHQYGLMTTTPPGQRSAVTAMQAAAAAAVAAYEAACERPVDEVLLLLGVYDRLHGLALEGEPASGAVATPETAGGRTKGTTSQARPPTTPPVTSAAPRGFSPQFMARIERAKTTKMYLLRQNGPTSFVVCTDLLYKKFRVTIGPQSCSCTRTLCVHVLFVMLRVLHVDPTDQILRARQLRDFEVETLMRRAEQHGYAGQLGDLRPDYSETDVCPICLLTLTAEDEITRCKSGCGKRLHENCMAVWAQERRRLQEKLICPLCRADWHERIAPIIERAPRDTRPAPALPDAPAISTTDALIAKPWLSVVPMAAVKCIFSKKWEVREAAIVYLEQQIGQFPQDPAIVFEVLCGVLAHLVDDPVFRVCTAAINLLRTFIAHPIMQQLPVARMHAALKPVLSVLLTRLSDPNKRFSTLTSDTLLVFVRDTRMTPPFWLSCALEECDLSKSWRWWLGRVEFGLLLLYEYPQAMADFASLDSHAAIFGFVRQALSHPHIKVKQGAHRLVVIAYRIAQSYRPALVEMDAFLASLKPQVRDDLRTRIALSTDLEPNAVPAPPPPVQRPCAELVEAPPGQHLQQAAAAPVTSSPVLVPVVTAAAVAAVEEDDIAVQKQRAQLQAQQQASLLALPKMDLAAALQQFLEEMDPSARTARREQETWWRKGQFLGKGACSECFAAMDLRSGAFMAVKQVSVRTDMPNIEELQMLTDEIQVMSELDHPNIVRYIKCEWSLSHLNIFLEFAAGGSLSNTVRRYGPLPESVVTSYTQQLLQGLAYLHDRGVVHRDLKPDNILLDGNGRIKLADFGASSKLKRMTTMTHEFRTTNGTPAYMCPEMIRGEQYGRKCDIWSLGAVVVEMITGQPPWLNYIADANPFSIMYFIASTDKSPVLPDNASPNLVDFVLRCMNRTPSARPSAQELLCHDFI